MDDTTGQKPVIDVISVMSLPSDGGASHDHGATVPEGCPSESEQHGSAPICDGCPGQAACRAMSALGSREAGSPPSSCLSTTLTTTRPRRTPIRLLLQREWQRSSTKSSSFLAKEVSSSLLFYSTLLYCTLLFDILLVLGMDDFPFLLLPRSYGKEWASQVLLLRLHLASVSVA